MFFQIIYSHNEAQVEEIAKEMAAAATPRKRGEFELARVDENGVPLTEVWACHCDQGVGFDVEKWWDASCLYRHLMGLALGRKAGRARVAGAGNTLGQRTMNTAEMLESKDHGTVCKDLGIAKMLRCRVRYFTAGAAIGSKEFMNEAFATARERFGAKRKDGAWKMRGSGAPATGVLWSARDLRAGV